VRVSGFEETQRSEESIVFQQGFLLAPGDYTATVIMRDLGANATSRVERAVTVPAFGAGSVTGPILAYATSMRQTRADSVPIILNPRGTISHGNLDTLVIYVEGYRFAGPITVPLEIRDERGGIVHRDSLRFFGGRELESRTVRINATTPPLGELTIAIPTPGGVTRTEQALVSFSRGWVVTNYDNLLSLLRFFSYPQWVARLRDASTTERSALWREFWAATDPTPETPENEALDLYFTRIAIANERWREEGPNAWRSDRGEVFITLGQPDLINTNNPGAAVALEQWVYTELRGSIYIEGQLGFNRMRMLPESRGEFAKMRAMVQRRQ
jgi:GWxTD domain-containing protein